MYAIVAHSGKQFRVQNGQILTVDFQSEHSVGDEIVFDRVLLVSGESGVQLGQPVVEGVTVAASVLGEALGDKIVVQKFRRRKTFRKKTGHRQQYTRVQIQRIGDVAWDPENEPVVETPPEDLDDSAIDSPEGADGTVADADGPAETNESAADEQA